MIGLLSRTAAVYVAATFLATAAQGQQATPGAAPPARTAAPATPAPSPTHMALARELITVNGLSRLVDPFLPQFSAQIRRGTVTRPELAKDLDQVLEAIKPEIEQQKQVMVDTALRFYTAAFTEAELKELIVFFKTATGQKYIQTGARLVDVLAFETRRWTDQMSDNLMKRVRTEMAKRGHHL